MIYRLKVCRKEAKESAHWLRLIQSANIEFENIRQETKVLLYESHELIKIFTSSILTSEKNGKITISPINGKWNLLALGEAKGKMENVI